MPSPDNFAPFVLEACLEEQLPTSSPSVVGPDTTSSSLPLSANVLPDREQRFASHSFPGSAADTVSQQRGMAVKADAAQSQYNSTFYTVQRYFSATRIIVSHVCTIEET